MICLVFLYWDEAVKRWSIWQVGHWRTSVTYMSDVNKIYSRNKTDLKWITSVLSLYSWTNYWLISDTNTQPLDGFLFTMNRLCVFSAICIEIILLGIKTTKATSCDNSLFNGYCRDRTISAEGDLNIVISVSIHESRDGQRCGDISVSGFQSAIAMEWIIKILNGNDSGSSSFIPGLTLGKYNICIHILSALRHKQLFNICTL